MCRPVTIWNVFQKYLNNWLKIVLSRDATLSEYSTYSLKLRIFKEVKEGSIPKPKIAGSIKLHKFIVY